MELSGAELAVGDGLRVRRVQHVEQVQGDARRPRGREPALLEQDFVQRGAVDPGGDRPQAAALGDRVDDVRDAVGAEPGHVLGGPQDPGGRAADALRGVRRQLDAGGQTGPAGSQVVGVPADPVGLTVRDLDQPVAAGDRPVGGGVRPAHW
ncbi:hypothetical protein ABTX83_24665 [Streptomyces werraensis]|uniref:hypothetical protein n=1 Tax=Streptomyces werraensis TaxID=68284 RepID=UPI0033319E34